MEDVHTKFHQQVRGAVRAINQCSTGDFASSCREAARIKQVWMAPPHEEERRAKASQVFGFDFEPWVQRSHASSHRTVTLGSAAIDTIWAAWDDQAGRMEDLASDRFQPAPVRPRLPARLVFRDNEANYPPFFFRPLEPTIPADDYCADREYCVGSTQACGETPETRPVQGTDILPYYYLALAKKTIYVNGRGVTNAGAGVVKAAWAYLYRNRDIAAWAACCKSGSRQRSTDVLDMLDRTSRGRLPIWVVKTDRDLPPDIRDRYGWDEDGIVGKWLCTDDGFPGDSKLGNIIICQRSHTWKRAEESFVRDSGPSVCMGIVIAGLIFHEILHLIWGNHPAPEDEACDDTYRAHNAFLWAMFNRYPDAALSGCCSDILAETNLYNRPEPPSGGFSSCRP